MLCDEDEIQDGNNPVVIYVYFRVRSDGFTKSLCDPNQIQNADPTIPIYIPLGYKLNGERLLCCRCVWVAGVICCDVLIDVEDKGAAGVIVAM